jgi:tetratricopeptide (TPR) repeat protein
LAIGDRSLEISPIPAAPDVREARVLLANGRAVEARALADRALAQSESADWRVLRADVLRALGDPHSAIHDLEIAATIAPDRRAAIGYRIATIALRTRGDPRAAIAALDRHGVTTRGSELEERGLALEIEADERLGDLDARARTVARYLERFPNNPRARLLR